MSDDKQAAFEAELKKVRLENLKLQHLNATLASSMSVLVDATGTTRLLLDLLFIVRELIDSEGVALWLGSPPSSTNDAQDWEWECLSSTTFSWALLPRPTIEMHEEVLSSTGLIFANISQDSAWESVVQSTGATSGLMTGYEVEGNRILVIVGAHADENHFTPEHVVRLHLLMPVLHQALSRRETERLRAKNAALATLQRESAWRLARVERALGAVNTGVATIMPSLIVGEASETFAHIAHKFGGTEHWGRALIERFNEELWHPFYGRVSKELYFDDQNGESHCIETHIVDGDSACFLLVKDITQVKAAAEALRLSEKVKDAILRSSLDAMVTVNIKGEIIDFNPSAERAFGYSKEEVQGRKVVELFIPKAEWNRHHQKVANFLEVSREGNPGERIEVPAMHKSGRVFPAELSVSETVINERRVFTAFIRDISDRKQAEQALEKARDAALAADHAKSELLATISHEVRTPLNAALGLTELALDSHLPPQTRSMLETAVQNARSLSALLDELLDYAREEASSLSLQNIRFNLGTLLAEVARTFALDAAAKNIDLRLYLEFKLPWDVRGDSRRLRQILMNLVGNAVKFTPKNETPNQVILEARSEMDELGQRIFQISVQDSGPGIEALYREQIFCRFERGSQKDLPGTGLGLPISRALSERMGGKLTFHAPKKGGSRFLLELPLQWDADGAENEPLDKTVLLIADDLQDEKYLSLQLECAGARVKIATSLDEKWAKKADCVLLSQRRDSHVLAELKDVRGVHLQPFTIDKMAENNSSLSKRPLWISPQDLIQALQTDAVPQNMCLTGSLGIRVLVVDDLADNRQILMRHLKTIGCLPDEAGGGYEAIRKVKSQHYDLVLMDINMPDLDGRDTTRAIRSLNCGTELPIIAVSAHAVEEIERECLNAGMSEFMPKPVTKERLRDLIQRFAIPLQQSLERVLIIDDAPEQCRLYTQFLKNEPYHVRTALTPEEAVALLQEEPADALLLDKELAGADGLALLQTLKQQKLAPDVVILISGHARSTLLASATHAGCAQVLQKPVSRTEVLRTLSKTRNSRIKPPLEKRTKSALIEVDPDIADLVPGFLAARKKDAAQLFSLLDEGAFDLVRRLGHNLKGSARSYGFTKLGNLGEELEAAASQAHLSNCQKTAEAILHNLNGIRFISAGESNVTQPLSLKEVQTRLAKK